MHRIEYVSARRLPTIHYLREGAIGQMAERHVSTASGVGRKFDPQIVQRSADQFYDRPRTTGVEAGTTFDGGAQRGDVLR